VEKRGHDVRVRETSQKFKSSSQDAAADASGCRCDLGVHAAIARSSQVDAEELGREGR